MIAEMQSIFNKSSKRAAKGGRPSISEPRGVIHQAGGHGQLGRLVDVEGSLAEFGALQGDSRWVTSYHTMSGSAADIRSKTTFSPPLQSPASYSDPSPPPALPAKYSFAPTYIPHRSSSDNSIDSTRYSDPELFGLQPYGFLGGVGARVVLGLEDVRRVVVDVARELEGRGLATPLLFSNQALELGQGQGRGRLLILAYIDMLSIDSRNSTKSKSFSHDLQYAKENELAWFLRWALSRITRKREGTSEICHGVMEWEVYEEWRGRERAANYPLNAFPYLSAILPSAAYQLLQPLFHLLSRLAAHSHLSGLTPHALSSLFAPLLFNVPASAPALNSHTAFIRAAAATEHLLLAYIRSTSRQADLGLNDLPGRLKEWVAGYPGMVVSDNDLVKGLPRKGARVVRCERATRVVRSYSKDLIATAETWAEKDDWPAWERVVLRSRNGVSRPKFTGGYRRRMIVKETPALPASSSSESAGPTEYGLAEMGVQKRGREEGRRHSDEEEARYGSLAGKEWSMFEEGGFGAEGQGFGDKLRFDLTETAKLSITERRKTMDWTDFAGPSGGFTRTDPALTTTLSFAKPLTTSIEQWPKERSDLSKRLHKSQKDAVPFHHDTTAHLGDSSGWEGEGEVRDSKGRVYLEEAFVDFWADLGMGGGWVDRGELTFRESSWAIMEYKAKPSTEAETHPRDDPRNSSLYFLFEEKVPYDYQYAIANPSEKRSFSMFTRRKKHPSALPPILAVPEGEFDRMLLKSSTTKKVTLNGLKGHEASIWHKHTAPPVSPTKGGGFVVKSREHQRLAPSAAVQAGERGEERPGFFFRSRSRREPGQGLGIDGLGGADGLRSNSVDFELQSISGVGMPGGAGDARTLDDDKWMDILVANGARKMARQDADPAPPRQSPPQRSRLSTSPSPSTPRRSLTPPPQPSPERVLPQIYHSPDASAETDEEVQTPRASSLSQHAGQIHLGAAIDPISPNPSSPPPVPVLKRAPAQLLTRKPLPLPSHEIQYTEPDNRDSWSSTSDQAGIHAPSPRRGRDTIHNIVDTYRDSMTEYSENDTGRYSRVTDTDEMYASEGELEERRYSSEREGRCSLDGSEGVEEISSPTKSVKSDGELEPPKPVFDLTPTREPSPGRYRHGEALHFVREEPEEEKYR